MVFFFIFPLPLGGVSGDGICDKLDSFAFETVTPRLWLQLRLTEKIMN